MFACSSTVSSPGTNTDERSGGSAITIAIESAAANAEDASNATRDIIPRLTAVTVMNAPTTQLMSPPFS